MKESDNSQKLLKEPSKSRIENKITKYTREALVPYQKKQGAAALSKVRDQRKWCENFSF
jgi:hypothetical protein